MSSTLVFVVDGESSVRDGIGLLFEERCRVHAFGRGDEALVAFTGEVPDIVLLAVWLPDGDGLEVLDRIRAEHPAVPVIMVADDHDRAAAVRAVKRGAHDYVIKPIVAAHLEAAVDNALRTARLRADVRALQDVRLEDDQPLFIVRSDALQKVVEMVSKVARSPDTPVLIIGETGTGKELIARSIHTRSPRCRGAFVPVNCAAIPEQLVESELFGYERGAFSGAAPRGKQGLIDEADGGTLFLDEVGDLSLQAQAKLLRFLEDGSFYRVGGTRSQVAQVRVVSATNRDLERMMVDGDFREDLYFRLGVITVEVPALNERRADIIPLAEAFLQEFASKFDREIAGLTDEARETLLVHTYRGNVRELRNIMERAVIVGQGPWVTADDLALRPGAAAGSGLPPISGEIPEEGLDLAGLLQDIERFYLHQAFVRSAGNESEAARLLGMNHHTYRYHRRNLCDEVL